MPLIKTYTTRQRLPFLSGLIKCGLLLLNLTHVDPFGEPLIS